LILLVQKINMEDKLFTGYLQDAMCLKAVLNRAQITIFEHPISRPVKNSIFEAFRMKQNIDVIGARMAK